MRTKPEQNTQAPSKTISGWLASKAREGGLGRSVTLASAAYVPRNTKPADGDIKDAAMSHAVCR